MTGISHLLEPIKLGGLTVPNRLMMTTHGVRQRSRYQRYLAERTADGIGLVGIAASAGVYGFPVGPGRSLPEHLGEPDAAPLDPISPAGIAHHDATMRPWLTGAATTVHAHGGRCVGQIVHLGHSRHDDDLQPAISASEVQDEFRRWVPHELTEEEIERLVVAYGHAGRRIVEAGLDGIEVHAAHGYLVNQFLSPATNHRTDRYGGTAEHRLRFLDDILAELRGVVGADVPIGVRINGPEPQPGGLDLTAVVELAKALATRGVAYLNISGGTYTGLRSGATLAYVASSYAPAVPNLEVARAVKAAVPVPVVLTGRITDLEVADEFVAAGAADMIGMVRAYVADPQIITKTRQGRADDVVRCIGCNECHRPAGPMVCAVNARAAHEDELEVVPTTTPRTVAVVGGGPAGMEAARVAALRGHRVVLWESADRLGGALRIAGGAHGRGELRAYLDHLERDVSDAGVDVRTATMADGPTVLAIAPDVLVLALGATEHQPRVPGIGADHVTTALRVLAGEVRVGRRVLVVGGLEDHLPPLVTADHLLAAGHEVHLTSELLAIGSGLDPATQVALLARLLNGGATLHAMTRLTAIDGGTIAVEHTFTRRAARLEGFDTVVLCCGRRARTGLGAELPAGLPIHRIGDCLSPRRLLHATTDGARLGVTL